jgi:hypothetical protein
MSLNDGTTPLLALHKELWDISIFVGKPRGILNQKLQNKWSFPFPLTTSTQIKN